jgi:DNA-binding transcriptional MerR regulator
MSIGELARRSGLSVHTIRFYESVGVLLPARRACNGHRRYNEADVGWLGFVLRLKRTGMPLAQIRHYAELRQCGDQTWGDRLAMLELHRHDLASQLAELVDNALALDQKISHYRALLAGDFAPTPESRHAPDPADPLTRQPLRARVAKTVRDRR